MEALKPILSPRELAEAVGVSESSIKRWADEGMVQVTRTAGGHRRIPVEEAIRFVRTSHLRLVKPEILGLSELAAVAGEPVAAAEEADRLFGYLRAGEGARARGLLLSLYLNGRSVAEIADGPLRQAMERVGELWQRSPAGVFWEHRATDIAIQALSQLRALLPSPRPGALVAVGGAPAGDPYILPSLAVAAVLRDAGVAATNLGPETPVHALLQAVESLRPRVTWLSVSSADEPESLSRELRRLLEALENRGATLVVGGRRRNRLTLPEHPRLLVCAATGELAAFVRGLATAGSAGAGDGSENGSGPEAGNG